MRNYDWPKRLRQIFERAAESYEGGNHKPETLFRAEEAQFLQSIGCSTQELFDFVEDFCRGGEPEFETVLLITAVRRDYLLAVQSGQPSGKTQPMDCFPPKDAELAGIRWLPRLIAKARAKLRGELPPELMYGCGGDRPFLRGVNVEPSDFLRVVWAAGEDTQRIVDYVLKSRGGMPQ